MPSPKPPAVVLTEEERAALTALARRRRTPRTLALRSRIVLRCADGRSIAAVATETGVSRNTVAKWRSRFLRDRLAGLADRPRPGRPRLITDEDVAAVLAKTRHEPPEQGARWSTRSMARATGMSQSAVARIWRAELPAQSRCLATRSDGVRGRSSRNSQ